MSRSADNATTAPAAPPRHTMMVGDIRNNRHLYVLHEQSSESAAVYVGVILALYFLGLVVLLLGHLKGKYGEITLYDIYLELAPSFIARQQQQQQHQAQDQLPADGQRQHDLKGCSSPEDIPLGRGCCLGRVSSVEEGLELIDKSSDDNLAAGYMSQRVEEQTPMSLVARIEDSVIEILREPDVKTSQGGLPDSIRRNMETQL